MYIGEWMSREEDYERRKAIYDLRNGPTGLETCAFNAARQFLQEIEKLLKEPFYKCDKSGLYMNWYIKDCQLSVNVNDYCFYLFITLPKQQQSIINRFEYNQIEQMISLMKHYYNYVNKLP